MMKNEKKTVAKLIVHEVIIDNVLKYCHVEIENGRRGVKKTLRWLQFRFSWKEMNSAVRKEIKYITNHKRMASLG